MYLQLSLFILFVSLNVCTARPLVAVEDASNTQINNFGKVSENAKKEPLESNHSKGTTKPEGNKVKNNIEVVRVESSKHTKKFHLNKALESTEQQEISGFTPVKSVASVSWHVPYSKQDQNPRFHSDYSRPRSRPPSHN
ncbi:hypothetical protein VNO77_39034 [Canavalia gladiata]|uniref:Uncharacterized protein n=1 Tax=Canavalia gladiata TaxID=3824 RepID=A0AAN9PXE3_CANGL